jgi:hypothetical protein
MPSQKCRLSQLTCDKEKIAKQSESDRSSTQIPFWSRWHFNYFINFFHQNEWSLITGKVNCLWIWSPVINYSDHTTGVKFCDVICWLTDHKHRSIFLTREKLQWANFFEPKLDDCMYLACSVSCINGPDLFVQILMSVLYFCSGSYFLRAFLHHKII